MIVTFDYFAFAAVLCVVSASKWDQDTLRVLTNELDSEILNYYSNFPNEITDIALESIRDYLNKKHETQIAIPSIDVNFTESILGLDLINGEFKAYSGVFTNPATIVRKGNSFLAYGVKSNLSTTIGFTDMEVYFPRYEATVIGIQETGDVKVVIDTNEIRLNVTINLLPKCTVSLTELKLLQFEDITTDITGLGILNGLADDITNWVLAGYETSFSSLIENVVANKLTEVLAKTGGFCKYHGLPVSSSEKKRNLKCQKLNATKYKCRSL